MSQTDVEQLNYDRKAAIILVMHHLQVQRNEVEIMKRLSFLGKGDFEGILTVCKRQNKVSRTLQARIQGHMTGANPISFNEQRDAFIKLIVQSIQTAATPAVFGKYTDLIVTGEMWDALATPETAAPLFDNFLDFYDYHNESTLFRDRSLR